MSNEILYDTSNNISEEQMLVLNIIQEYLNKNRTFNRTEIIPFINARVIKAHVDISYMGICEILKSLVEKNIVVEGTKFTKYNILSNSNRSKIYEYIIKNPGVHFNKLVKTLKISIFSVEWHLNVLMKFNFIRNKKINGYDAYFLFSLASETDEIYHILSRDKCNKIIQFLKENNEGYSKNYLSKELNIHPNTVSKYIDRLDEFGLLIKKELPNMTLYFLNERYYSTFLIEFRDE